MTLREADEAAQMGLPVIHQGIEYSRITQTGYKYAENGDRVGFVQLLDKCGNSVTDADPAACQKSDKQNEKDDLYENS